MFELLDKWMAAQGFSPLLIQAVDTFFSFIFLIIIAAFTAWLAKRFLVVFLETAVRRSSNQWDDSLVARGFFRRLGWLLPLVVVYLAGDLMFVAHAQAGEFVKRLVMALFVLFSLRVLYAFIDASHDIYNSHGISEGRPVKGYIEIIKIVSFVLAAIFIVSFLTARSPWGVMSVLGGLTAVLLLIFKDMILGFVASLQMAANDMVKVGDWIEMEKFGADGDVIDVSIHTVKVRNWDKTITTIPTYALVSNSFKNWRGMSESGGRRIKRPLYIDMNTIHFCSDEMLEKFEKYELLKEYLANKKQEIENHNREKGVDTSALVNGRRQTNIGVFRAYAVAYLKNHPNIHQDMTFLVRQLAPTPQGLPLEIYVFSNDQVWANYEAIQSDIFDHLLAVVPEFGLKVYQYPSGNDLGRAMESVASTE